MPPLYDADAHVTAVPEVHDVLLHATVSSSDVVPVGSFGAKFRPEMVTVAPPDVAALGVAAVVTTAASNVNQTSDVPTNPPTVTCGFWAVQPVNGTAKAHDTVVAVLQAVVVQPAAETMPDAVASSTLKFVP